MIDNQLIRAVGKLQLSAGQSDALRIFIAIALRQRQALKFYALQDNYIDGVPHMQAHTDDQFPDDGTVARYALGDDRVN